MVGRIDVQALVLAYAAATPAGSVVLNSSSYSANAVHENPVGVGSVSVMSTGTKPFEKAIPTSGCLEGLIMKYINTPALADRFLAVIYEKFENLNPAAGYSQSIAQRLDGLPVPLAIKEDIRESARAREAEAQKRRIEYTQSSKRAVETVQSPVATSASGGRIRAG